MATPKNSKPLIYVAVGALVLLLIGGLVYVFSKMTATQQQAQQPQQPEQNVGGAYVPGKGFQIAGSVIGGLEGVSGIFLDFWNTFKSTKNDTTAEYTNGGSL